MKVNELETSRLLLRQWRDEDFELFAQLNSDKRVMEYFPALLSREESDQMAEWISSLITANGWGFWALEEKDSGKFIGFTGLHAPLNLPFSPCVEIGWRLAHEFWGKGFATEAARACLKFGFGNLELNEIVSFTALSNARSRAVMERLGMCLDEAGYFDHPNVPVGHELQAHCLYRMLKQDWLERGDDIKTVNN